MLIWTSNIDGHLTLFFFCKVVLTTVILLHFHINFWISLLTKKKLCFLFLEKLFNWRIIALQFCVDFCSTTAQRSHNSVCVCVCRYIYISPPSWAFLPLIPCPNFLGHSECQAGFPVLYGSFPLAMYFTYGSVYMWYYFLNLPQPFLPPLCPQVHSLHLRLYSCPTNKLICTIFLDSIHIINMQYSFFHFWFASLCIRGSRFIRLSSADSHLFLLMAE